MSFLFEEPLIMGVLKKLLRVHPNVLFTGENRVLQSKNCSDLMNSELNKFWYVHAMKWLYSTEQICECVLEM